MARYILIEVNDNEIAGDLVKAIQESDDAIHFYHKTSDQGEYQIKTVQARVRGLMAKPVNFCQCKPIGPVVMGAKLGWLVCTTCGKPYEGACQHPRNLLAPEGQHMKDREFYLGIWEPNKPATKMMNPQLEYQRAYDQANYRGKRGGAR